jgi:hypothetical protein
MKRKLSLGAVTLVLLYAGVGFVLRACASDETKIRRLLGEMETAYDEGQPGACVRPLAKGWRHAGYELDREQLLGALFQISRERDRETHELLSRVAVDEDAAEIAVDGAHATLACEAVFSRLRRGTWQETWRLRVEAELAHGPDGWQIVASRHHDLAGTELGR